MEEDRRDSVLSRRRFLAAAGATSALFFLPGAHALVGREGAARELLGGLGARSQEGPIRVGHVAPAGGPMGAMGRAARRGARLGAQDAGRAARLLDRSFELLEETGDTPDEAVRGAERLVDRGASAVVGGIGDEACSALMEAADRLGVPFLNVGSDADRFRGEACSVSTFHVQASETMYVDATVHWLVRRARQGLVSFIGQRQELWRWHVLYEGTPQGRRLHERARATLERAGGELLDSTEIDPERGDPAGALREALAGDPWFVLGIVKGEGLARLLEAHRDAGSGADLALPFADTLRYGDGAPPEAFWPSLWHSGLFRYGARELNNRYREAFDRPMGPQGWANWTAVKLLGDLLVSPPREEGRGLVERLEQELAFDGYKGPPLSFRSWNHQMGQGMYVLRPSVGETVADPYQVIGRPVTADDQFVSRELVDRLGMLGRSRDEAGCRLGSAGAATT